MTRPLFALTLTHPWAAAITHLGKRVENRMWEPPRGMLAASGGLIAIHGGAHPGNLNGKSQRVQDFKEDLAWIGANWKALMEEGLRAGHVDPQVAQGFTHTVAGRTYMNPEAFITPGVVAVARVADVVRGHPSLWAAQGQYQWVLEDVRAIEAIPCPGKQKLWPLPTDIAQLALARYEAAGAVP